MDSWPLTARGPDLERLGAAFADPSIGGVVITGPAGVGRTQLGEEVLNRAGTGPVARVVGHTATRSIPLGALSHLLPGDLEFAVTGSATGGTAVGRGTDEVRSARFHRARAALSERAGSERLIMLVDDIDLLDETSLAVLLPLTVDRSIFLVASLREGRSWPAVVRAPRCARSGVERLRGHRRVGVGRRSVRAVSPPPRCPSRRQCPAGRGSLETLIDRTPSDNEGFVL